MHTEFTDEVFAQYIQCTIHYLSFIISVEKAVIVIQAVLLSFFLCLFSLAAFKMFFFFFRIQNFYYILFMCNFLWIYLWSSLSFLDQGVFKIKFGQIVAIISWDIFQSHFFFYFSETLITNCSSQYCPIGHWGYVNFFSIFCSLCFNFDNFY